MATKDASRLPRLLCFLLLLVGLVSLSRAEESVSVDKVCYSPNEVITISFNNTGSNHTPQETDWVGIIKATNHILHNGFNNSQVVMWAWTCGRQFFCTGSPNDGVVQFGPNRIERNRFPLKTGQYQAILSSGSQPMFPARAVSPVFSVLPAGQTICEAMNANTLVDADDENDKKDDNDTNQVANNKVPKPTRNKNNLMITTDKKCYSRSDPIVISFNNTQQGRPAQASDWVGLYRTDHLDFDIDDLSDDSDLVAMWVWTCGTRFCRNVTAKGSFVFGPNGVNTHLWPLDSGEYRAILTSGHQPRYKARAVGHVFTVMDNGQLCDGTDRNIDEDMTIQQTSTNMVRVITRARSDIEQIVQEDKRLGAKFLRLAFHDCVGGCDGCVDLNSPDNAGLARPIDVLKPLVTTYGRQGLSRTDVWMLAAVVASDVLQPEVEDKVDFPFQWIGRQTCKEINKNKCGTDFDDSPTTCTPTRGPHREMCHGEAGTDEIMTFFNKEFGFNAKQVVAIMGAHSVGSMRRSELGFQGNEGWDVSNTEMDQGYHVELTGGADGKDGIPDWRQVKVSNDEIEGISDRFQWEAELDGKKVVMLNVDVALVRNIRKGVNMDDDGKVTCPFKGRHRCPNAWATLNHVIGYGSNLRQFLTDYRDTLELMINNGYRKDRECPRNQVCRLKS